MMDTNTMIRVGPRRLVTMRYTMKNATANVLANTLDDQPVTFVFGSGEILPGLEAPLAGLKIGEHKSFCLSPETSPGLDQIFYFDVVIDDIRWITDENTDTSKKEADCGPDCAC
ncbi:MAG: FKBP-type peptidyl-prolyl cis-trans isomerase [Chryseosolibacter sp.]